MAMHSSLKNHFLIAMPNLEDPNFSKTVTYICEHNEQGAMGIVLNRPTELRLTDILNHMDITEGGSSSDQIIYLGGPVEEDRGFVIHTHTHDWDSTMDVTESISVTTSRDILEALSQGDGPDKSLIALGYAGWGAGQLEQELQSNAWLSGPADPSIIFDLMAKDRWRAAAKMMGVDIDLITTDAGHA
jgi:putative transcriptional regulator